MTKTLTSLRSKADVETQFNPSHPNTSMHTLLIDLSTFP